MSCQECRGTGKHHEWKDGKVERVVDEDCPFCLDGLGDGRSRCPKCEGNLDMSRNEKLLPCTWCGWARKQ